MEKYANEMLRETNFARRHQLIFMKVSFSKVITIK